MWGVWLLQCRRILLIRHRVLPDDIVIIIIIVTLSSPDRLLSTQSPQFVRSDVFVCNRLCWYPFVICCSFLFRFEMSTGIYKSRITRVRVVGVSDTFCGFWYFGDWVSVPPIHWHLAKVSIFIKKQVALVAISYYLFIFANEKLKRFLTFMERVCPTRPP